MPLESATYISDLDPTNPVGSSDLVSSLDDHMRLVKATLKNTFPNIDGAVTATEDELNHLDGVTGTTGTGKLVLDDAPTIANLTVTDSITLPAKSVSDAALSDNVPLKNADNVFIGQRQTFQHTRPVLKFVETDASTDEGKWEFVANNGQFVLNALTDGDQFGATALRGQRSGATVAQISLHAAAITFNGVNVADFPRKSQPNTFTADNTFGGEVWLSSGTPRVWLQETDAGPDNGLWHIQASGGVLSIGVRTDAFAADNIISVTRSGGTVGTVTIGGDVRASRIATSTSTTLSAGQIHAVTGNSTLPNMTAGQWVGVINNSNSPITVTKSASDTMYWTASGSSVTSVTVAARGKASFICADGANVYASGNITGAS